MKKAAAVTAGTRAKAPARTAGVPPAGKIHPVVVYPFKAPNDYSDLEELYAWVARLAAAPDQYARPLTVIDRKTHYGLESSPPYRKFRQEVVARHSEIVDAWCVDTCQMWYTGLGLAGERGQPGDVYWLIPGDFNYGTAVGREVLSRLHDLPEICLELEQDLCVGEIATDHNHSKQLIDTYGTFALLYTWFPAEAQEIRGYTERPRSEFFAIRHPFLLEALRQRWYAHEQTVVLLLQAVLGNRHISRFSVGNLSDLPTGRESLASAIQQVERTERVLKALWLDRNQNQSGWAAQFHDLERQSEGVRRTALIILGNLLT
ncbi:MAG: hypothetical protein FJ387_02855 [Verrucomicrobia bacterium]|nr:hypothetical protein [Verrucomicrobiota bacterium]